MLQIILLCIVYICLEEIQMRFQTDDHVETFDEKLSIGIYNPLSVPTFPHSKLPLERYDEFVLRGDLKNVWFTFQIICFIMYARTGGGVQLAR